MRPGPGPASTAMTVAILPMKPPGQGKTRLAGGFDPDFRADLSRAMYRDVLAALLASRLVDRILVVSPDPECLETAARSGAGAIEDPGLPDHSAAAAFGAERASAGGADRVLMVPGDCPALDPAEVDRLLSTRQPGPGWLVVPDRHGTGTNALVIEPADALRPAFGPDSHRRHLELAARAGLEAASVAIDSLAFDVDTPDDLAALIGHLDGAGPVAAETRALLSRTGRMEALA